MTSTLPSGCTPGVYLYSGNVAMPEDMNSLSTVHRYQPATDFDVAGWVLDAAVRLPIHCIAARHLHAGLDLSGRAGQPRPKRTPP